jgi:hypothetical protein
MEVFGIQMVVVQEEGFLHVGLRMIVKALDKEVDSEVVML